MVDVPISWAECAWQLASMAQYVTKTYCDAITVRYKQTVGRAIRFGDVKPGSGALALASP